MQYYGSTAGTSGPTIPAPTIGDSPAPPPRPPTTGAASFLFEAAAAKTTASPKDKHPSAPVVSIMETPSSDVNGRPDISPKAAVSTRPVSRRPPSATTTTNAGPTTATVNARVNNHQLRLHASGNEKAPLSSNPTQHGNSVTTLMIRNIPNRYSQSELLAEIREAGFDNKFDFFYLPMDHETHANFGYAFINFVDEREVDPFTKRFNGLKLNRFTSNKIIQIVPAQLQGFQANLQHYCKKAVCTDDNIDYRPLFFVDGKCLEFHRAAEFSEAAGTSGSEPQQPAPTAQAPQRSSSAGNRNRGTGKGGRAPGVFQRRQRDE